MGEFYLPMPKQQSPLEVAQQERTRAMRYLRKSWVKSNPEKLAGWLKYKGDAEAKIRQLSGGN